MNNIKEKLIFALVASLTLGLAPFYPEPHLYGKIRWMLGGGVGMSALDYLDALFHGLPWGFLIFYSIQYVRHKHLKNPKWPKH